MTKKVLVILNNIHTIKYEYLSNNYKNIKYIYSIFLINISFVKLQKMILKYDIIFIGGGPQHLTTDKFNLYPEFINIFNVIKICDENNILLIGICLGCQLIAHYYNAEIIKLNKVCIGTHYLNINSLNKRKIYKDKYLCKLNYNLLQKSFSFHHDAIKNNNNKHLYFIAFSNKNNPYIIKHKQKYIYGFQFHPEILKNNINNILNIYNIKIDTSFINNITDNITKNFFDSFLL